MNYRLSLGLPILLIACISDDPYSFHYTDHGYVDGHAPTSNISSATLRVRRQPTGDFMSVSVLLDGALLTVLKEGDEYAAAISPGRHMVSARCTSPFKDFAPDQLVQVEAGQTYIFRIYSQGSSDCLLAPMLR